MGIAAGVLLLLMSIAHIVYGEQKQIPALKAISQDQIMIGSLRIMIYQSGCILLAIGLTQLLWQLEYLQLTGVARYFPVAIVLINVLTSFFIILIKHRQIFKITFPQFIIFSIIILLQWLSI